MLASPTLYSGQTLRARLISDEANESPVSVSLYIKRYNELDEFTLVPSEAVLFKLVRSMSSNGKFLTLAAIRLLL